MRQMALIRVLHIQPVGMPGLYVMMAGFAIFFVALLLARLRGGGGGSGTVRQRSSASVVGVLIQMIGFAAVGFGPVRPVLDPTSKHAILEAVAIGVLMLFTILTFFAASRAMGRNWSVVARTREDHELVTTGPVALIRHPIYTALFVFMLALAIAFGHWFGLIAGVPLYWIGTWIRITAEERMLRTQFGAAYDAYAARVKRFFPGIF